MSAQVQSFPLAWPEGWKRALSGSRKSGQFSSRGKPVTIAVGIARVLAELGRMGIRDYSVIVSTNVRVKPNGMPYSGEPEPRDSGVAVYWRPRNDAKLPMRCMAIDRYRTVADNLAAIGATLEAMRAIERHGGAEILDRAFTGFAALPASTEGESWWTVLGVSPHATQPEINEAYRLKARHAHPDNKATGSQEAMQRLNAARDQATAAPKGRSQQ